VPKRLESGISPVEPAFKFKQNYAAGLFFFPVPGDGLLSEIGTSVVNFHFVLSLGWFGQSGNLAPSAIAISTPQQTLRYTPNLSLMSPFQGTAVPLAFNECVYASKHSPTLEERNFNSLAVAVPYHTGEKVAGRRMPPFLYYQVIAVEIPRCRYSLPPLTILSFKRHSLA
jgi:hypothetical protein